MGLDTVELVLEVEEAFGIVINDRDAEQITTMGGLHRYVLAKLQGQEPLVTPCPSAAVFYRLRHALIETFGIERDKIRPDASVEDLISARQWHASCLKLQDSLDLRLPQFKPPPWVIEATVWAAMFAVLAMAAILSGSQWPGFPRPAAIGLVLVAASAVILIPMTWTRFADFPDEWQTVRGLVLRVIERNPRRFSPSQDAQRNPSAVWDDLCHLVSHQTGVDIRELTEETRFVDDLGMD